MTEQQLLRDARPIEGNVFCATPFGEKSLTKGGTFNFDELYIEELAPTISECGMTPVRADSLYGPQTVEGSVWRGIQQAEVVIIDFTAKSPNVSYEYALAKAIGKRVVYLTQDPSDIPTDVRGVRYILYSRDWRDMKKMRAELLLQLEAIRREPATEMALIPMAGGGTEPAPARIVSVSHDLVVVETDDGRHGVLHNGDVDLTRLIPDMTKKFQVGERLNGAFEVDAKGGTRYTLTAGKPNPWSTIETAYPGGTTFTTTVHNVVDGVGVFARVDHGINGLIPRDHLPAGVTFTRGSEVEVTVKWIDKQQRRIQLQLVKVADVGAQRVATVRPSNAAALPAIGARMDAEVVKVVPEQGGKGGFLQVKLPGRRRPALLLAAHMSDLLREDLNRQEVETGELLTVEVVTVDPAKDKVLVKEIPDVEEIEQATAA